MPLRKIHTQGKHAQDEQHYHCNKSDLSGQKHSPNGAKRRGRNYWLSPKTGYSEIHPND